MSDMPIKKRCCICHEPFRPDHRVGARQRTCLGGECQTEHRRLTQEAWRKKNPSYFADYYLQKKVQEPEPPPDPAPLPPKPLPITFSKRWLPAPLNQIPWDYIAQVFTPEQLAALKSLARLLVQPMAALPGSGAPEPVSGGLPRRRPQSRVKDEMATQPIENTSEFDTQLSSWKLTQSE